MNVIFEEKGHDYYMLNDNGSRLYGLSMTTFISKFKQPFLDKWWKIYKSVQRELQIIDKEEFKRFCNAHDAGFKNYSVFENEDERIAFFKSKMQRFVKWLNVLEGVPEIKKDWDIKKQNACDVGTEFHEYKENKVFETKQEVIGDRIVKLAFDEKEISSKLIKYSKDLKKLEDGYHPEVLLYTNSFTIGNVKYPVFLVGQVDKVFVETIKGVRYVDIDDYKSNAEIKMENRFAKMKAPIEHLEDCDMNHYSLQVSGYGEILRQHGFVPRNLHITHHDIKSLGMTKTLNEHIGKEKVTPIKAKNLANEFSDMIKHSYPVAVDYKRNYITKEEKKSSFKSIFDYD